ncbi:MAG TPA: ATP-binding cassette domain-containing protein [Gammaproteobacteria bacterium]|nr:ATP-binding cassette domain-containing protein [Gammaproteobacteria bacterium]
MSALYEIRNLKHSYGGQPVLDIPRLTIESGEITALVGPNGAGKSTLLRLLALVEFPEKGVIFLQGSQTHKRPPKSIRRKIGWVMQHPFLFRGSALDNVTLGLKCHGVSRKERKEKALLALHQVGFNASLEKPAKDLSGGQRQLIALAQVLALEPEVLLLDEPFTHLDRSAYERLEQLLKEISRRNVTVLFSTHDQFRAMGLAKSMIALENGQLVNVPWVNLLSGICEHQRFKTGKIEIVLPDGIAVGNRIAIDPRDIVLSKEPLQSSMRNRFQGRVTGLQQEECGVRVTVMAGERFEVLITHQSCKEMGLTLGHSLWVNFKSTAIKCLGNGIG